MNIYEIIRSWHSGHSISAIANTLAWPSTPPDDIDWGILPGCDDPNIVLPPAGCEGYEPVPCSTGDALVNNSAFQSEMQQAWLGSYGPDENPFDQSDRVEKLIMITATSSGYVFDEIIPDAASSCHMTLGSGFTSAPQNIAGFIHTHPYKHDDIVTDPNCPKTQNGPFQYDGNVVSSGDESLVQYFKDNNGLPAVPMYVIDKEKIRVIQPSNPSQYSQNFNRCGY